LRKHALRRALLSAAATALIIAGIAVPAGPALAAGTATITGHLTDAAGQPLANALVSLRTTDWAHLASVAADANGVYTASGLEPGEYIVSFSPFGGGYTQYLHQRRTYGEAEHFVVAAGATIVADDQALPTGRITGTFRNRDGSPLAADISVYTAEFQDSAGSGTVAPDGTFSIELLAGSYKLNFSRYPGINQYNGGVTNFESAAAIEVVAGQTTPWAETLMATGSIAGRLTNADGSAAAGVGVFAETLNYTAPSHNATTDADGRYRMDGVPLGDWIVGFEGPRWIAQYAHGKLDRETADRITVADAQVSTVDEQLLPTGTVRIVAHDATTGAPLSGFCAWALRNTNLSGCAQGAELVLPDAFAGVWRFDVNIGDHRHFDVPDATVTVTGGQTSTIDVAMRRGASLTVPMAAKAGGATAEGCALASRVGDYFPNDNVYDCSDWQSPPVPGTVVIGPIEAGTYQIFADPRDDALGAQWVGATGGTGDRGAAAQLTLAAGDDVTAGVVRFDAGGSIRGKVTDLATGAPVDGACVSVTAMAPGFGGDGCPVATIADGTYTIAGLGPYAWPVEFVKHDYQWRWSGNAVTRPEATTVTVRPGRSVAANIKLRTGGGTVAGFFHDAGGHPIDGAVLPYNAVTGEAVQFGGQAYGGGPYTIAMIAPQQSVKLRWYTNDGRSGWVGGSSFASAASYPVKNNKTTTVNITIP
jgi:hypothetical protein